MGRRRSRTLPPLRHLPAQKKPSDSGKSENEGIHRVQSRTRGTKLASSFSLSEKSAVPPARGDPDEHSQTGILTSGFGLAPAFPVACVGDRWQWGARIPSQWRNRPRFPRGSLAFGHDKRSQDFFAPPVSKNAGHGSAPQEESKQNPGNLQLLKFKPQLRRYCFRSGMGMRPK
jgi:hypothetical protein